MRSFSTIAALVALLLGVSACSLMPPPSFPRASHIDIDRYMGAWYVIANIPPSKTKNAYDSIERYSQGKPGVIHTVFTYRNASFDGKEQVLRPTGYVQDGSGNAVWGMQFFWPIKLQYVISYVSPDYSTTIVARSKRDWVWIMARKPKIDDATYQKLVQRVADLGYDTGKLRRVPQQPLDQRDDLKPPAE